MLQILHERQLVVRYIVLFLQFVIFFLEALHGDFEQFGLAFVLQCTVVVELVLLLLIFVLALPLLDLLPESFLLLLLVAQLTAQFLHRHLQLLDLEVLDLSIRVVSQLIDDLFNLDLLLLDVVVVRQHVLVLVFLQHL